MKTHDFMRPKNKGPVYWLKCLWWRWLAFTLTRVARQSYLDEMMYGNSYVGRAWWGWYTVSPLKMVDHAKK